MHVVVNHLHLRATLRLAGAFIAAARIAQFVAHLGAYVTASTTNDGGSVFTVIVSVIFHTGSGRARLTLMAYEPSAGDGSPTHEIEIPLTLAR